MSDPNHANDLPPALKQQRNRTRHGALGWVPDVPDKRDVKYVSVTRKRDLPASVDLRPAMPAVYDQGQLGSCTANAIAGAIEYDLMRQRIPHFTPSRLFVYYNERLMEHSVSCDAGAQIRDGVKSVNRVGAPNEADWPYDIAKFAERPTPAVYQMASEHKALSYARVVRTVNSMRACLADGFPFTAGISVYESFESDAVAASGDVPMADVASEELLGGHAVLVVGYDSGLWIARNSWGNSWGKRGYFTLPEGFLLDRSLSDDFWAIKAVQ